jgi:hypothetical protein
MGFLSHPVGEIWRFLGKTRKSASPDVGDLKFLQIRGCSLTGKLWERVAVKARVRAWKATRTHVSRA